MRRQIRVLVLISTLITLLWGPAARATTGPSDAPAAPQPLAVPEAVARTFTVTSTSCTGPGSITEAMALANANPGTDTITFTPGLQINPLGCPPLGTGGGPGYFIVQATESVIFEGNGAQLVGNIQWINSSGDNTNLYDGCPNDKDSIKVAALTPGFMRVGLPNQDNSAISVTVRDLDMHELNSVAWIEKNASLILEDLTLNRIIAAYKSCAAGAIEAQEGANFTARRTQWQTIWNFGEIPRAIPQAFNGAIRGFGGAGDLTLEDSYFKEIKLAGTIQWFGQANSTVNIVTSRFEEADGIYVGGAATTNIVNTLWSDQYLGTPVAANRIINTSTGPMNIIGSTLLYPSVDCNRFCEAGGSLGWIYRAPGAAKINFVQSAIGVAFPGTPPTTDTGKLLDPGGGDGFTADEYTWIQPTAQQDAAALKAVTNQPSLLTDPPGLPTGNPGLQAEWATPLDPGELIDRVPDAVCPSGTNALINPIDGTCITEDVLGNPRVDANGTRNIGAVQLTLAPHLTVTGTGNGTVDLSWTKPQFSAPATGITGYQLRYRETGAGSWTTLPPVPGPGNLSVQASGLTNGTKYEFEVRATYSPSGEGPWSNTATGTPLGPIGAPVVTATPGNGQVDLSWTKPSDGGHVINVYSILWRPAGTTDWIGVAGTFGTDSTPPATQTTITGLTNGTEYEFAVTANASGVIGPQGTTKATPVAPGTVTIIKLVHPSGGAGFSFAQTIDGSGDFTLGDQNNKVFTDVPPGTYTVTEADPQGLGYELKAIICFNTTGTGLNSEGDVATRTATINVASGEKVFCQFANHELALETVVIEKRTLPSGGSGFTFSDDIGTPNVFTLDDAQTRTFTHVPQGTYQVTEDEMPGYKLTAIDCNVEGASVPGDLASRTASISLSQPGGSAHCTFTNTKLGTIIMRKETLPDGAPEEFGYGISGPDRDIAGSLDDGDFDQVDDAEPGTWVLEETIRSNDWHLGNINCTSALGTSAFTKDVDNLKATVELAPGDTVDCTFTNVEDETITVEKVTVPAGDTTTAFAFTGSGSIGDFALLDGEKQTFSVDAEAGPYTLTEADPSGSGYEVTEIECVNSQTGEITFGDVGTRSVVLDTQPGESQRCTFTNERHGQVIIRKATAPGGGSGFGFYGSFGSFSLNGGQQKTVLDVAPGAYSVSEVDPTLKGYGLTGIRCSDSDPRGIPSSGNLETHTATINLDAGETVDCTFTNSEPDTVSVLKTTLPPGGTGFDFDGDFGPFALDDGDLTSFDNLTPGTYTITEDDPTPAYDLALILCHDASTGEFFEGDVDNRQVELDLEADHQVLCEFVNVQRGTIIIEKAPGSGTGYDFSGDLGDFTLDSGQEQTFLNQPVGEYTVTEQTPPGDLLTDLICTDSDANGVPSAGDVATRTATINLDPGETVRCTYTNQPGGSVVIRKAVASGPRGPFTFLDNIKTPATFDLSHSEEQRFDGVLPGTYTVQEAGFPAGSGLAQIECVDSDASGTPSDDDLSTATAIIHLDAGETVECTFTNALCVAPAAPAVSIAASGTQVRLSWSRGTSGDYGVFRSSNAPYFTPALPPYAAPVTSPWLDPDTTSIGDVANNYFYVVQAANTCRDTADSNRVGEFDFTLMPGTP